MSKHDFPSFTSYGCYPCFLASGEHNYCADCAHQRKVLDGDVVLINWSTKLYCAECERRIESAYGEEGTADD